MKKIIITSLIGLIICSSFKSKKIKLFTSDYRDTYIGTYSCKYYCNQLSSVTKHYENDTGRIDIIITKDVADSVVRISLDGKLFNTKLINKGLLSIYVDKKQCGGTFFAVDSLKFFYNPNRALYIRYIGKKK